MPPVPQKNPAGQADTGEHDEAPASDHNPEDAWHVPVMAVMPEVQYDPAGHAVHADMVMFMYVPGCVHVHWFQNGSIDGDVDPAGQGLHAPSPGT
jgi:hypothetical protein